MKSQSRTENSLEILLDTLPFPAAVCVRRNEGLVVSFSNTEWQLRKAWPRLGAKIQDVEILATCRSLNEPGLSTFVSGPENSWLAATCLASDEWSLLAHSEYSAIIATQVRNAEQNNIFRVFDNHQDCILVVDADGIVRYANQAAFTVLGDEGLLGEAFGHPLTGPGSNELDLRRTDGRLGVAEMSTQSTSWDGHSAWLVTLRDITELKLKELQLRQAQKMEIVGQLAGGIAHDFNNLLMAIGGHAELLGGQLPIQHPGSADLVELRKAIKMGTALANKLLTFSRDKPTLVQCIEVNQALTGVSKTLSRLLRDDISLSVELAEKPLSIKLDSTDFVQILMNLVLNAQDAIEGCGDIVLGCRLAPLDHQNEEPRVEVYVRDNGKGMKRSLLDKVFQPFFSTKGFEEGTGLGLAVIDHLVRQYRGRIQVQSLEGKGTLFRLWFPYTDAPVEYPSQEEEVCAVGQSFRPVRILLVDDHELVRNASRRFLERLGYQVITARSAEEALVFTEDQGMRFELLITDVVMPGLNGFQLAAELQKRYADLKVLYMSGYTGPTLPTHRGVIAEHIMKKPFGLDELREKLSSLLNLDNQESH